MVFKSFMSVTRLFIKLLILIIFISFIIFIYKKTQSQSAYTINADQTAVIKEIQELGRLETAAFTIEKIIDAKTNDDNVFKEFLFGDKILLIAHGKVIAGVDLATISNADIELKNNTVKMYLPATEVFTTYLNQEKTRVYDREQGVLNKGDKDLESAARKAAEESIYDAACEAGILDEASQNAKKQMEALLKGLGFEEVTVEAKVGKCN